MQPVAAIQTEYSFVERAPEHNGVLDVCEELGIGFVPWGPVGMGFLTGSMTPETRFDPKTDYRHKFPRFSPENIRANLPILDIVRRKAAEKGTTPAQISLAWLLPSGRSSCRSPARGASPISTRTMVRAPCC